MLSLSYYQRKTEELYENIAIVQSLNKDLEGYISNKVHEHLSEKIIKFKDFNYYFFATIVEVIDYTSFNAVNRPLITIELCFMSDNSLKLNKKSAEIKRKAMELFNEVRPKYFYLSDRNIPLWLIYKLEYNLCDLKNFDFLFLKEIKFT